jgi:uncharacterized protein YndB with AHSA1/START domain
MSDAIHQEVTIPTTPDRVFAVLTDTRQFTSATGGAPAEIDPVEGGLFSCFGGKILGRNIEIVPDRRVVQAWRVKTWQPGIYSIARFELESDGTGTRLSFDHSSFPPAEREHLASGWYANYWEPLTNYLAAPPAPGSA